MWGWRFTLPSEPPCWELSPSGLPTLKSDYKSQDASHWRILYIIGKLLKCRCLKWARMTHLNICNTSYGKKKGRESIWVKLAVWLPTMKSQESTRLSCVQVACNTPLESYWQELHLCFRPHPNWRSKQEVIAPQSRGSPNPGSFGTSIWESRDKKSFGCNLRGEVQNILYGGRWWLPPSPSRGESCESKIACGLS